MIPDKLTDVLNSEKIGGFAINVEFLEHLVDQNKVFPEISKKNNSFKNFERLPGFNIVSDSS